MKTKVDATGMEKKIRKVLEQIPKENRGAYVFAIMDERGLIHLGVEGAGTDLIRLVDHLRAELAQAILEVINARNGNEDSAKNVS